MNPLVPLPLNDLVPSPDRFTHSTLHGQAHVARVMVHASRLIAATGWTDEAPRLWAAVYIHDIARTHDGYCVVHGRAAVEKIKALPIVRDLFARGGLQPSDYLAIETAVVNHCRPQEIDRSHPHYRLTSLLKDADGLDRVRLGDLNPKYLRNPQALEMIGFAQALFDETHGVVPPGAGHFATLWPEAMRILGR